MPNYSLIRKYWKLEILINLDEIIDILFNVRLLKETWI